MHYTVRRLEHLFQIYDFVFWPQPTVKSFNSSKYTIKLIKMKFDSQAVLLRVAHSVSRDSVIHWLYTVLWYVSLLDDSEVLSNFTRTPRLTVFDKFFALVLTYLDFIDSFAFSVTDFTIDSCHPVFLFDRSIFIGVYGKHQRKTWT